MPGRTTTRNTTAPRNKSPARTLTSRSKTTSPTTIERQDQNLSSLRSQICSILSDAQKTTVGQRKLVVGLRKIQEVCCYEPTQHRQSTRKNFCEDDFNEEITRCVIRLMVVKRSEAVGDRLIGFLGVFLRYANDKDAASAPKGGSESHLFSESPSTRLTLQVLSMLLAFLTSKEKTVRFRSTQLVAHIINSLDALDDEHYHRLKIGLLKRIKDKEPMIRVQAVLGLGRLASNGDDDEDQESGDGSDESVNGLLPTLVEALQNDPSADVRRSLLLNLPLTPGTLPFLLERARDLDASTRRVLYSRLLPALGDFRHLSLSMREKLLRWGLRDRDENVRRATAKLFSERWIEDCVGTQPPSDDVARLTPLTSSDGLLELLERIDVINSGVEDGIASEAMKEFWSSRPDYRDALNFNDEFWDHLSPESVFMARSFNDFCRESNEKLRVLIEEKMPELTKFAFFIQGYVESLTIGLQHKSLGLENEEHDTVEQEFIVEQLLHMAKTLDYTDEVGRRKMFALLRETLAIAELPDEITKLVIDVLRGVCGPELSGERNFCGVVLEAVAEVHDAIATEELLSSSAEESFHSALSVMSGSPRAAAKSPPETAIDKDEDGVEDETKAIREIMINMKCLHIAQCMLQNVEGDVQQNVHLVTMLNNLVVPAVRSHEAPIRERGLVCLGLCCLLDKNLASENLTLFMHCFSKGHDALQLTATHILTDILTIHPNLLRSSAADVGLRSSILKLFARGIKAEHSPDVQFAATTALCKLMLMSIVQDEDLLKQIVICYFDPLTKENAGLRQALSYFLPVYCHCGGENMVRMATVAVEVMHALADLSEELAEKDEMVGLSIVGNMLVDWTDSRKLVLQDGTPLGSEGPEEEEVRRVKGDIHLRLAEKILERVTEHGCSREEKKALIGMLGKLHVTANSTTGKLHTIVQLVAKAIDCKIANDAVSRNSLAKFHSALNKAICEIGRSIDNTSLKDEDHLTAVNRQGLEQSVCAHQGDGVTETKDALPEGFPRDEDEDL